MTILRCILGLLWLTVTSAWMLFIPCLCLWRFNSNRLKEGRCNQWSFRDRWNLRSYARSTLFICMGILLGLGCFWWEFFWFCVGAAVIVFIIEIFTVVFLVR